MRLKGFLIFYLIFLIIKIKVHVHVQLYMYLLRTDTSPQGNTQISLEPTCTCIDTSHRLESRPTGTILVRMFMLHDLTSGLLRDYIHFLCIVSL